MCVDDFPAKESDIMVATELLEQIAVQQGRAQPKAGLIEFIAPFLTVLW